LKDASDYLTHVKALIALNPQVVRTVVLREEMQGDMGLYRYRLTLRDGSLLEMFERFSILDGRLVSGKYSFHWQDGSGRLLKRWDNATHQPGVATYPHHIHDGADTNVLPHESVSAEHVLTLICQMLDSQVEDGTADKR